MQSPPNPTENKNSRFMIFCSLFFLAATAFSQSENSRDEKPKEWRSSVEVQWEDNPSAVDYEIQILDMEGKLLKTLPAKTSLFKIRMPVNKYKLKARYRTKFGNLSPWSEEVELIVPPKPVKFAEPKLKNVVLTPDLKTMMATTTLHWTPSPQGDRYIVKIKDENGVVVKDLTVDLPEAKIELALGHYTYSVTALTNGLQSKEITAPQTLQVDAATLAVPTYKKVPAKDGLMPFNLAFDKRTGQKILGELIYSPFLSEKWDPVSKFEVANFYWGSQGRLKPGRYKVSFWMSTTGAKDSQKVTEEFAIKPTEQDLSDTR